jgi:hypothetical protein
MPIVQYHLELTLYNYRINNLHSSTKLIKMTEGTNIVDRHNALWGAVLWVYPLLQASATRKYLRLGQDDSLLLIILPSDAV